MAAVQLPIHGGMPEAPIVVKVSINDALRKFKLHLSDVAPAVFADKLRALLQIPAGKELTLERYSDSSASYITLSTANPSTYKQLYRAAKAKSKLRLRATVSDMTPSPEQPSQPKPIEVKSEDKAAAAIEATPSVVVKPTDPTTTCAAPASTTSASNMAWQVCCNNCDKAMLNAHYHCGTCHDGDYDLCETCVAAGVSCPGTGHWLIKRSIVDGKVINSTTERLTPKPKLFPAPASASSTLWTKLKRTMATNEELLEKMNELMANHQSRNVPSEGLAPKPEPESAPATSPFYSVMSNLIKCHEQTFEEINQMGHMISALADSPSIPADTKASAAATGEPKRTCNACVRVLPESALVTCRDCDDYDLCIACTKEVKHGHHPAHTFAAITDTKLPPSVLSLCAPGRAAHHWAICDGCDSRIQGVRHKCLDCPDWDFCSACHAGAQLSHPGHRFVPVFERMNFHVARKTSHFGIYCDGPLCKDSKHQSYIQGVRYKCAICHDTDFCANCEAHPKNKHNKTHPMLMFKTPVKNASISTVGEDGLGVPMAPMGDRKVSTPPQPAPAPPAAAPPKIVPLCPFSMVSTPPPSYNATTMTMTKPVAVVSSQGASTNISGSQLDAHFVCDTVSDGSKFVPNRTFIQQWTLRNPGPHTWPAGVTVRTTGGDNMLNIDPERPAGAAELAAAQESQPTTVAVRPGSDWRFTVTLRTPQRAGKHISYWRAKAPDGTPFGHKLWCEIEVDPTAVSEFQPLREGLTEERVKIIQHILQTRRQQAPADAPATKTQKIPVTSEVSSSNDGPVPVQRAISRAANMNDVSVKLREMQQAQLAQFDEKLKKLEAQALASSSAGKAETTAAEQKIKSEPAVAPTAAVGNETGAGNSTTSSQMVFPTLDKESPASSTQLEAKEPATEIIASAPASVRFQSAPETVKTESVQGSVNDELVNDFDSVEFEDETDDDDNEAFLTDEEYDILDASDEEVMHNGVPAAK